MLVHRDSGQDRMLGDHISERRVNVLPQR
jgi:hypothetical protein